MKQRRSYRKWQHNALGLLAAYSLPLLQQKQGSKEVR